MTGLEKLRVKIFSDGASMKDFRELAAVKYIKGFTTNPSLMKKAGVTDYDGFIREVMPVVRGMPISFEVICDDFDSMREQALKLSGYGKNVYVKIPVSNTRKEPSAPLVKDLTHRGVNVNVTAVLTLEQVEAAAGALEGGAPAIISIFAGRIADTGVDPVPVMKKARGILKGIRNAELLWASTREMLNIFQAEEAGCDIITVPPEIFKKANLVGYDTGELSLDTVKQFSADAASSGLKL